MRFGIFGDIHSNLEALEAVLDDMQSQKVTHTVCIGDIVGCCADPAECLRLVRSLGCPIVKGNHDEEAAADHEITHTNEMVSESMRYCRKQLNDEQKAFLRALPLQLPVTDFTIVHSSLDTPARWGYVFSALEAESSFTYQRTQLCFFGHTHVPHVFIQDTKVHEFLYRKIDLKMDKRYFINVGSVGQPRDGDWRAAYAIYDTKENTIELRRIPYDLAKTQQKIMNRGIS